LVYKTTPEEDFKIEQLMQFIAVLRRWRSHSTSDEGRAKSRSLINEMVSDVQETVHLAGLGVTLTATPPALTGGPIMRGLDPFDLIFDPPYGIDVIPNVIDMVERTIGKIRAGKFPVQVKSNRVQTSLRDKTVSSTRVFLVHGHDDSARETVARFLEKVGLKVVILSEQAGSSNALIEKLERYSDVAFAVVLLTPDDIGGKNVAGAEMHPRARQNVILELGYFMGKLGRGKTVALLKGDLERPSDYDGVNYVAMEGAWQLDLAKELRSAGLKVDLNAL